METRCWLIVISWEDNSLWLYLRGLRFSASGAAELFPYEPHGTRVENVLVDWRVLVPLVHASPV